MKENPHRKKANSALQHPRIDFRSMMDENALSLVCIHRDIFLDYYKIINIYASIYPRRMLLINPLSENKLLKRLTLEKHMNLHKLLHF